MGRVFYIMFYLFMNYEWLNLFGLLDSDGWVELGLCNNCIGLVKFIGFIISNDW